MPTDDLLTLIKRIKSIADIGKLYAGNAYDIERYQELEEISFDMLQHLTGSGKETLQFCFAATGDYPTAKVDVRGILLSADGKLLMTRESSDGKWSVPGGWADVGYTPSQVLIKEFKEETGLDVIPERLLAVFDKKMHPHPPQPSYVYKLVFLCKAASYQLQPGHDVLDVQYFDINNLPEFSEDRILKSQIELLYHNYVFTNKPPYFD